MEAEYERTRDKARAYLSAIDELTLFREQVSQSTEEGKEGLENALEVSEPNRHHRHHLCILLSPHSAQSECMREREDPWHDVFQPSSNSCC